MPRPVSTLLLALSACAEAPEERPIPEATPWAYDPGEDTDLGPDPDALARDLQALVDHLPQWRARPLLDSYAAARVHGDDACPAEGRIDDGPEGDAVWWYGACRTSDQVHFNGVMTAWGWDGHAAGEFVVPDLTGRLPTGYTYTGGGFEGRIDIFDERDSFHFSCSCEGVTGVGAHEDGRQAWFDLVRGPASWTGPEADGTWLREREVKPIVFQLYTRAPDLPDTLDYTVDAEVSGVGERYRTMRLLLNVTGAPDGDACTRSEGRLTFRDVETAAWGEIPLGPDRANGCETCFTLDGQERCADVSGLLGAAGALPW